MTARLQRLLIVVLALTGTGCSDSSSPTSVPETQTVILIDGVINVPPGDWGVVQVNVTSGMQNPRISATFTAAGGSGNDIKTLVMNATDYQNWSNGHSVTPMYNSGQITTATFGVDLTAGVFYVVYDNTFSTLSSKAVTTRVDLMYES